MARIGVILGRDFKDFVYGQHVNNLYGDVFFTKKNVAPHEVFYIRRTSDATPEFMSNSRANVFFKGIFATKRLDAIVSVHTAIAICDGCEPDIGLADGLDYGTLGLDSTYSEHGLIIRANMNPPFSNYLSDKIRRFSDEFTNRLKAENVDVSIQKRGVFYDWSTPEVPPENVLLRLRKQVEGLRYLGSSRLASEAILAREAGISYVPVIVPKGRFAGLRFDRREDFNPDLVFRFVNEFIGTVEEEFNGRGSASEVFEPTVMESRKFCSTANSAVGF